MGQFQLRNTERARSLRNSATPAERHLWKYLSRRQLDGHKFSRQMPIGPYFADFLCREAKLVVELDGYSHDLNIARDTRRTAYLEQEGYRVIRFNNDDALHQTQGVLTRIAQALTHPRPLPHAGGEH